jgi:hypothetical protein
MTPYRPFRKRRFRLLLPVLALGAAACASMATGPSPHNRINHVLIIYQKNWTLQSLCGRFLGPYQESQVRRRKGNG